MRLSRLQPILSGNEEFMRLALDAAWQYQGLTYPNPAVGCVVVQNGAVIATGAHKKAGEPHAEVMALKNAYMALSSDRGIEKLEKADEIHEYLLKNHHGAFLFCEIYVTLEPCTHEGRTPSCANLLKQMRPQKVYVSQHDPNPEAKGGVKALMDAGIDVEYGLCELEGKALLKPFEQWSKKQHVTFKWAQRLDGSVDGGLVSDAISRDYVHAMRDVCDLIVIGGNTVRLDRPTLDARRVNGKAPDVLILSHETTFDESIPLFSVPERKVMIADHLDKIAEYKNILIEGGPAMFDATQAVIDRYLCFLAPSTGGKVRFTHEALELNILHTHKLENDLIIWMEQ
jgi:diaminohydroxyphosphoribosylaminopyrimidine deaminase/5-amino-6-(5-phosphoribosylamino)uracil reductase